MWIIAGAALASAAALIIGARRVREATVTIDLDASRRWVTLGRVHSAFAAACQAHEVDRARQS
jgi:hypothetical protein